MERIILEVDEQVSKMYQNLTSEKQQQLLEAISMVLKKTANDATATNYRKLLDEFGGSAVANGITPEILESLLKKND